jgi:predicted amidohydrolase
MRAHATRLRIALSQCVPQPLDIHGNLQRMQWAAQQAQAQGADVLLFPEMFMTGYNIGCASVQALACPRDQGYCADAADIARQHQIHLVFGYPERAADGRIYNAAQCISPQGQALLHYRKTHLYGELDRAQFSAAAVPENQPALTHINGWNLGLLICYDVEFPENTRRLALAGADLVLVPTANMNRYDFVPDTMVPTRAFENQIALAYANYCGNEGALTYGGLSSVVDALGQPLAKAQREECMLLANLLPADLHAARTAQTHLQEQALRLQSESAGMA